MKMWFEGPVERAIARAKAENHLLMVFINGDDEISRRAAGYFSIDYIQNLINHHGCVALKLQADGQPAKMFAQIYPVVSIPSTFFISPNGGLPLEIIVDYGSLDSFQTKLAHVFEASGATDTESRSPAAERSAVASSSQASAKRREENADNTNEAPNQPASLDERAEKARGLLKERQEEKARQTEEDLRSGEIKRRHDGRDMGLAQQRLKEAEALQAAEERKKAKKEDQEHLKRVREQIAADRAEKAAKFNAGKETVDRDKEQKRTEKQEVDEAKRREEMEKRNKFALIQFRLPDGSAFRNQFDATVLFAEAEAWIAQKANLTLSTFVLVQMLPRREFTDNDRVRTLRDLDLVPSAVLMILPLRAGDKSPKPAPSFWSISNLINLFWTTVCNVYEFVYTKFFGGRNRAIGAATPSRTEATKTAEKDKNIGRLRRDGEDKKDDDNATWNGNSTQQL